MIRNYLFAAALVLAPPVQVLAVTIDWSLVGNPGNSLGGFGAVDYIYNIGTYDVTVAQYVEFLNAKDSTGSNSLGIYNPTMSNASFGGINFNAGNPDGGKYAAISGRENYPVNYVDWYDTIRFANWINNGQGNSDTETGAYTLGPLNPSAIPINSPITHNAEARVWLPTENEWFKAAYYNPATNSIYRYATSSDTLPTASPPTDTPNSANYANVVGHPTEVGAYSGSMSPYGAFDMAGNISQWNEEIMNVVPGPRRGIRGGSFGLGANIMDYGFRGNGNEASNMPNVGFRLAAIPEPSSFVLAALGLIGLVIWRRRARYLSIDSYR